MSRESAQAVADAVRRTVSSILAERDVIVVAGVLAAATPVVRLVRELGARDVLVVALSRGTGDLPDPEHARCVVTATATDVPTIDEEIRSWQAFVDSPPDDVRAVIEEFDPAGAAVVTVLVPVTLDGYLGRETYGGRPPAYTRLEDKTTNDAVWAGAGVTQAPYAVVDAAADLRAAARALDDGRGTVWSADASDYWNGGGDRVWWVRSDADADADEAAAAVRGCARQVRIMPFLEGVPCSIHGLVLPDGVAVFRPVEVLVLRTPSAKFFFAGVSTWWDPPPADRQEMREVARRTGELLGATHGYRGAFCVDGVLTQDGFRPTELNSRFSAGLNVIAAGCPDLPLRWAHDVALRGGDPGVSALDLGEAVTAEADAHRVGFAMAASPRGPRDPAEVQVLLNAGTQPVTPSVAPSVTHPVTQPVPGTLQLGPSVHGAFVRFITDQLVAGQRLAPLAIEAFAEAKRLWDLDLPPLEAAPEVPRRSLGWPPW